MAAQTSRHLSWAKRSRLREKKSARKDSAHTCVVRQRPGKAAEELEPSRRELVALGVDLFHNCAPIDDAPVNDSVHGEDVGMEEHRQGRPAGKHDVLPSCET